MKRILLIQVLICFLMLLSACGSRGVYQQAIEQQISENKLVPVNVIPKHGILDAYHHLFPEPEKQPVMLNLAVSKNFISSEGDDVILQVGLSSQKPAKSTKQFHYLVVRPWKDAPALNHQLDLLMSELKSIKEYAAAPTFDWSISPISNKGFTSLSKHEDSLALEKFLRRFLIGLDNYDARHFVIVMADHLQLDQTQKQNIADMADYLAGKGATVSVLSIGESPDIGFLRVVTEKGNGLLSLKTESFRVDDWYKGEESYISASTISDVKIKVSLGKNIRFKQSITGENTNHNNDIFMYMLKDFKQGEQRVSLFELAVPLMMLEAQQELARVELSAYDVASSRYYADSQSVMVTYSNDPNQITANLNDSVGRSLTILNTADAVAHAARLVQNKRPYQAMNVIFEQKASLQTLGNRLNDSQLKRDAEVLGKYEQRLFDFADESFQSLKSWLDLNWDNDRFTAAIE